MSCLAARNYDADTGRYECSVTGDECRYLFPDSIMCAELYGEGPDAKEEPCKE